MNGLGKAALLGLGGATLFATAFVVFAALSGAPLSEVAFVGRFVPDAPADEPPDPAPADGLEAPATASARHDATTRVPDAAVVEANVGVLGAFLIPAPYTSGELAKLQGELRAALADARRRTERVAEREGELDEWERTLGERLAELQALRAGIEKSDRELALREAEVARDESAKRERDAKSWAQIARFFESGDTEELAQKLVELGPEESARILRALDEERAGELVNALPADKYAEFLEAFRAHFVP